MIQKYLFILGTVIRLCYSQTRVFINIPNCVGLCRTCLPPANEVCEGYVFTGVCLSTGGSTWAGTPQAGTPWAGTPPGRYPLTGTPPPGQVPPQAGTPLWAGASQAGTPPQQVPPRQVHPPRVGTPRQVHHPGQVPPGYVYPLGRYSPPREGTPPGHSACWDTVNKRAVRIPLKCILVLI